MDGPRVERKSPSPALASSTWRTKTSRAMVWPTSGRRARPAMSLLAVGILPLVSTQMEPFTLSPRIWIVMIFGSAVMMVQHGRMIKFGIVMYAEMQTLLLTAMITFTSLITTVCQAMATCSIQCMMEHRGRIIGVSPILRMTKFPSPLMPIINHISPTQGMDTFAMRQCYPIMTVLHGQPSLWMTQPPTLVVTLLSRLTLTALSMLHTGTMVTWTC